MIIFRIGNLLKFRKKLVYASFKNISSAPQSDIVKKWQQKLQSAEFEDAEFTVKCILAHILDKKFNDIDMSKPYNLTSEQVENFEKLCECRLARMPLQYIIKEWDFRDLTLKMIPTVFIPRPETEGLVSLVIESVDRTRPFRFIDVGCGSGAICLSLLKALPESQCIALDRSTLACQLTEENSKSLGLRNRIEVYNHVVKDESLLPEGVEGEFDAVISNPPYIKTSDLLLLQSEVKLYENLNALHGGPDGLEVVRVLLKLVEEKVVKGGKLWMELDPEHPPLLKTIIETMYKDTLRYENTYKDIFQKDRFIEIKKL